MRSPLPFSVLSRGLLLSACIAFSCSLFTSSGRAQSLGAEAFVETTSVANGVPLVHGGAAAPLHVDAADYAGVQRAVRDLAADFERVSHVSPSISTSAPKPASMPVLIGTLGKSTLIDSLVSSGKLDARGITGRWEAFVIEVVQAPLPGIERALVIAGSDKRGTIYGIYELSEQIGVSPWYWWADVPVKQHSELFARSVRIVDVGPAVKYRGIFLNDEAPSLTGWVKEKFGNYNRAFYERVFELILRLRGNYLWPAMWSNAFNEDDPDNPRIADEYGIVMGTSHHEPMLRAQQEWARHGSGHWNYANNAEVLAKFWAEGIRRNRNFESIVTIGMRGDGDMPMSEESNVALLQKIVSDQRDILARETGREITQIPQLWALYKEVQDYFEKGMRVPDDVTLLWCDDNWGNIRRLPTQAERSRPGGAGVYYHFDYVGGPRSYKWLNTIPITKVWEQMNLAYQHDANRIWIVNVGDLKPMEFPIEFFLRMAWSPTRWSQEQLQDYTRQWARRDFGPAHAEQIAGIISAYTKFNSRRKPEMLEPETYSLVNYREAETVVAEYNALLAAAEKLYGEIPVEQRDAFFQLVLHPVKACAIVNELHVTAGLNRLYAVQGRAATNTLAARTRALFQADADLARVYNEELGKGRWRHFMDQNHLGYTYWQQPVRNAMPAVTELQLPDYPEMGVAIEGSPVGWQSHNPSQSGPVLPEQSCFEKSHSYIEVFNRGLAPFSFAIETSEPWLLVSPAAGEIKDQQRVEVSIDWSRVPAGNTKAVLKVKGPQGSAPISITVPVSKPAAPTKENFNGFVEVDRVVAIEAAHFSSARNWIGENPAAWRELPDFGRTHSGMTLFPVTAASREPGPTSPQLAYSVYLQSTGSAQIQIIAAPTLNYTPGRGLRCAVSFDDEAPQIVDLLADRSMPAWEKAVSEGVRKATVKLPVAKAGPHMLRLWMVDAGVVVEKLIIDMGGLRPSYLGPRESPRLLGK